MSNTSQQKNDDNHVPDDKSSYWDTKQPSPTYPQLEAPTFSGFMKKIGLGLALTFFPAIVFSIISQQIFLKAWGIAIFLASGLYFVLGGCSDLSETSASKSFKQYMEKSKYTQSRSEGFKFDLKMLQFGKGLEDIAAAVSLLGIAVLISTLAG